MAAAERERHEVAEDLKRFCETIEIERAEERQALAAEVSQRRLDDTRQREINRYRAILDAAEERRVAARAHAPFTATGDALLDARLRDQPQEASPWLRTSADLDGIREDSRRRERRLEQARELERAEAMRRIRTYATHDLLT
jgi:hypothetical protein